MLPRIFSLLMCAFMCSVSLAFSDEEVMAGAARMYRKQMTEIDQRAALDTDAVFLARVQRLAQRLILQAGREYPQTLAWQWEIHSSSEDANAYCMAGGKLLVSQTHVINLRLNDAELAMLLSHEIEHALQQHNLKEYNEALRRFPVWSQRPFAELELAVDEDAELMQALAGFNFRQEIEADHEGLKLAWRAGWPPKALANYFKKLARASRLANFDTVSHPAPARRWQAARELAQVLEGTAPEAPSEGN